MKKNDLRPPCRHCQFCECNGRQQSQSYRLGRKRYMCNNPETKKLKDKHGLPLFPFVRFGDMTRESPLVLKIRPRWCPLKGVD